MNDTQNPPAPADAQTVPASAITPTEIPIPTSPAPAAAPAPTPSGNVRKDAAGVPFDPARHLEKMHPHSGRWMPRAQKGVKKRSASSAGTFSGSSPGANSNVSPPAPVSFIPATPPPAPAELVDESKPAETAEPLQVVDHSDDAAEVGVRAVQFGLGVVLDAPEDVTPAAAEHRQMVKTVSAYVRAKGWQATAGVGLVIMFAAYVLRVLNRPRPMAKVRGWFSLDAPAAASKAAPASAPKPDEPRAPAAPSSSGLPPGIPPLASS